MFRNRTAMALLLLAGSALMLIASLDRPIRFIVHQDYFDYGLFTPFMKSMGCIPVVASGAPRVILKALRDAGRYLEKNELVCIFPEGQITRTGTLLPFRRGLERITGNREAPSVRSIWAVSGGASSAARGPPLPFQSFPPDPLFRDRCLREPSSSWYQGGRPAPACSGTGRSSLDGQGSNRPAASRRLLPQCPAKPFFSGPGRGNPAETVQTPGGCRSSGPGSGPQGFLDRSEEHRILLPPTVAGVLVNIAASLSGRVSVNLNYTTGKVGMESAI